MQDKNGYISVQFKNETAVKKFLAPSCFKQFLQLLDLEAADKAAEDNRKKDMVDKVLVKEKREDAKTHAPASRMVKKQSRRNEKSIHVPSFSSISDFYAEQEKALLSEISYLKRNGGKRIKLFDGKCVKVKNGRFIYSFVSDSELNLPDHTHIILLSSSTQEEIPSVVVNCEDFTITIASTKDLGDTVTSIEFTAESSWLLTLLIERLQNLRGNSPIVNSLICDGRKMIEFGKAIRKGQDTACQMSLEQDITFIWGPPGTGKTETLAKIAILHLSRGHRVLMLSYSNVSVDGAIWRVFKKDTNKKPGKLVRYGYPRDKALLQHEYLTSYNLALRNHPELIIEHDRLMNEKKHLSRTDTRLWEIDERLKKIEHQINAEEKHAVSKALFVATTVSKAIADSTLYQGIYDTVIFDEASMAYIPQIVFSAGLAQKHFVCMGDFAQLPPIVQSDSSNILNADIFQYCGIVDAVNSGYGHSWLCMLDTQFRMHPDIAAFSSRTMYNGLLKSGVNMKEERKQIVTGTPFPGDALRLIDLSGMMSVCTKTADQSRINLLSALIAFGFAVNAAKDYEVGIITPYNAQSRLLHAMSRDVAEQVPNLHKITCATVHQFQGSEKDVIIYDAVDCYWMKYPGTLLSSTSNNYANRLYNVAVTRAKGKMLSIVNVDYMEAKRFSNTLIFRNLMDTLKAEGKVTKGNDIIAAGQSNIVASFTTQSGGEEFINDLDKARREISIDIPGGTSGSLSWFRRLSDSLLDAKKRGLRIILRTDNKMAIPKEIRPLVIENKFITNPVTLIDRYTVWYGMPPSDAAFISENKTIPTRFRPILRFQGKYFARSLYSFLEMNQTVDTSDQPLGMEESGSYNTFAAYVAGEMTCCECGGKMRLKKSKKGKFFLSCGNYPKCGNTQLIEPNDVENYFYFKNKDGKRCPQDNTSLEAKIGKYGLYVCCNGLRSHRFKLDEI